MNHLKHNEKPGSTTNCPDDQEESFLDFLIPVRLEIKQEEHEQKAVSPNLFEFIGHLFSVKPHSADTNKERYDSALFWVDVVRSAERQPTEPDKAFFIKSNRTIH